MRNLMNSVERIRWLLVRAYHGLAWAVLTNKAPDNMGGGLAGDIDSRMWSAVNAVTTWPTHDLFGQFP